MKTLRCCGWLMVCLVAAAGGRAVAADSPPTITISISTPMPAPEWAKLQRRILAESVPACREFYERFYDARGYVQCFVRWGANDGPDDAFENFNRWPELHALGASDEIKSLYLKGHEGMLRQYSEAKTVQVPIAREGMYHKEFIVQSDWMHHGEGLQLFNRMGLGLGRSDATYVARARRFAGFYMAEDPDAPNYDPKHKLIRSMMNGSRGPMLRKATALDWAGDPFNLDGFDALHGEKTWDQFLAHYDEYTDVVGDHFLNLAATSLPTVAFLATGDQKYRTWLLGYMDAWLDRMKQNGGVIPSFVDLDGKIGGKEGRWWGNAYGWGFSPVNPVNGRRENRNRIPWAIVGFNNALLVSGNFKYIDAWRAMTDAVNSHARRVAPASSRQDAGATSAQPLEYPTMHGKDGWYGWQPQPWSVAALDVWYFSMQPRDLTRVGENDWVEYLQGRNPGYPQAALQRELEAIPRKLAAMRAYATPPEKRLADNMMQFNPAPGGALVHLMMGALMPGRPGGLLNARLRYFDPERKRAGLPEDVAALVSEITDTRTVVTFVNTGTTSPRSLIVQGGGYGEHGIEAVEQDGRTTRVSRPTFALRLEPGAGAKLALTMKRYSETPTVAFPWERR